MPVERLQKAWLQHAAAVPIEPAPRFTAEGLVLGAGTILAANDADGRYRRVDLEGVEPRLLALLSAAYGRSIDDGTLSHIRRAALRWSQGDDGLASVHLSLTRLGRLAHPRDAARRLFMADVLMEAGAKPDVIFSALGLEPPTPRAVSKFYHPSQPRVPAGNGRAGGRWARIGQYLLQGVSSLAVEQLGRIAARFPAITVFLGVLFIPGNKTSSEEEYPVPGHPGLRVGRLVGETGWRIIYDDPEGHERSILQGPDGALRDPQGHVVGRALPDGHVAIDLAAVAPNQVDSRAPRYCPAPVNDYLGGGPGSIPRAYEDQVKRIVNPEEPTPSGMAVALSNPARLGAIVKFDDCQHRTGMMVEAKGPTFTDVLRIAKKQGFIDSVDAKLVNQATRQVQAAGPRAVRWYFADTYAADHARDLFIRKGDGLERIEVAVFPYLGPRK
ncbi:MAG: hypothetical protein P4L64_04785 [Caulobacteraceae bacterium]|nr:hypothetical protein [Caulobacteraceae bacterium]